MRMHNEKVRMLIGQWVVLGLIAVGGFSACSSSTAFIPTPEPNPWTDDYSAVSSMENYKQWGAYNVHDPACKKIGDTYYMYSTDAIFRENKKEAKDKNVPLGYIQVRKSKDLVNWEFVGWAFPEIPEAAIAWVHSQADGKGATNIWAPYLIPYKDKFRLYYSVSAFGLNTSYIGMAESESPEGPWIEKGCVVKTGKGDAMNAIDPSVLADAKTGKWWMHYGSYFGGLYCVELNPESGLPLLPEDKGHLTARRANYKKDNLEAPEIMYHPQLGKYFLFTSYDPLMTTYNVRVAYSDCAEGPFVDFFGTEIKDTTNNFPILTAPYRFEHHPGWAGTAHCGIIDDGNGRYFMAHQGRLSPQNHLMNLHLREVFFTESGWPVVSPQRYTGTKPFKINEKDLIGEWEVIRVQEPLYERQLNAGQILWGEGELKTEEWNQSTRMSLQKEGVSDKGDWKFSEKKQTLNLTMDGDSIRYLIVFAGHDWENETETILFTGLDNRGRSVWGKRVK